MKIEVPYELGDPIIIVEFNQHDGYYIEYKGSAIVTYPEWNIYFQHIKKPKSL